VPSEGARKAFLNPASHGDFRLAFPFVGGKFSVAMSTEEIISELEKLGRSELEKVDAKLHQLLQDESRLTSDRSWGEALLAVAATGEGLPTDLAHNHDHYLHGTPRK
jgi:hypothetical protein